VIRQARRERRDGTLLRIGHLTANTPRHHRLAGRHRILHLLLRHTIGKLSTEEPALTRATTTGTTVAGTTVAGTTVAGTALTWTALIRTTTRHRHAVLLHAISKLRKARRAVGLTTVARGSTARLRGGR
jgi:hypothetical protein